MSWRLLPWLLITASLAAIALMLLDGRRVAEIAGQNEIAARQASSAVRRADAELRVLKAANESLQAEVARLSAEVGEALGQAHALGEALTAQVEAAEQQATERASAGSMTSLPPPSGVQRCLEAVRECLVADGFTGLRLVTARALQDFTLHDVELLDVDPDGGVPQLVVAAEMTAAIDRAAGALTLRFRGGWRRVGDARTTLPEEGFEVRLHPVEGRFWEARLPYLVRAEGAYPEGDGAARPAAADALDGATKLQWTERLDDLLARAGTELRLRIGGFRALHDHRFLEARVLGYDQGNLLALTADCAALAIEVDERAGVVSLLLREGSLRQRGGISTLTADGYRMLLPNVTPQQASDLMFGMVVRK